MAKKTREYRAARPEYVKSINRRVLRDMRRRLRMEVLAAYGMQCKCCGETEEVFLAIDHVNDDGAAHRRTLGAGWAFYRWLKKNGFPQGFQTLCHNCNWAKSHGGCPHQKKLAQPTAADEDPLS